MTSNYRDWPLKDIRAPHHHDVLCGRGGGSNSHVGNMHWRMLVTANKELYVTLPKKQKLLLSLSIVNAVRSQSPPGRFLQKDAASELYYDVGDQRAQEKTSQALREGAPDIKKKIANPLGYCLGGVVGPAVGTRPVGAAAILPPHGRQNGRGPTPVPLELPPPIPAQGPVSTRVKKKQHPSPLTDASEQAQSKAYSPKDESISNRPLYTAQQQYTHGQEDNQFGSMTGGRNSLYPPAQYASTGPAAAAVSALPPPVDGGLEPSALSFGTYMSIGTIDSNILNISDHYNADYPDDRQDNEEEQQQQQQQQQPDYNHMVPPVDGGLESFQGTSFGTAVMSVDSLQLERAGLSVGSMMSMATMPTAVDGGLDAIGTSFGSMSISRDAPSAVDGGLQPVGLSFGSLSLTAEDRALLISSLREDNVEVPEILESAPTFLLAQRSKGNLLECSDTDSDDDESRIASSAHPSADWEKLQATLAQNNGTPATSVVPPPFFPAAKTNPPFSSDGPRSFAFPAEHSELCVPTTGFDRDLSALSVGDYEPTYPLTPNSERDRQAMPPPANRNMTNLQVADNLLQHPPPPPAPLQKEESDQWECVKELEAVYLARGNSLGEEFTNGSLNNQHANANE